MHGASSQRKMLKKQQKGSRHCLVPKSHLSGRRGKSISQDCKNVAHYMQAAES